MRIELQQAPPVQHWHACTCGPPGWLLQQRCTLPPTALPVACQLQRPPPKRCPAGDSAPQRQCRPALLQNHPPTAMMMRQLAVHAELRCSKLGRRACVPVARGLPGTPVPICLTAAQGAPAAAAPAWHWVPHNHAMTPAKRICARVVPAMVFCKQSPGTGWPKWRRAQQLHGAQR